MAVIRKAKRKNNFVILDKEALWNPDISNKAIGLWARCMSRPDDWKFHVKELEAKIKDGSRSLYAALEELIQNRYVMTVKGCARKNGKFTTRVHEYVFFEGPATDEMIEEELAQFKETYEEIYWEIGKFKKFYRDRRFGDLGNGDLGNGDLENAQLLNIDNTKTDSTIPLSLDKEKENITKEAPEPPSTEVDSLCSFLLERNKEKAPDYEISANTLKNWQIEMDRMLRIDKRSPEKIREAIIFASTHKYYSYAASTPKSLRKHFNEILIAKATSKNQKDMHENRKYALQMKEKYPEQLKSLSFDSKFVCNTNMAKEVPFSLPQETFKDAFLSIFGGSR